MNEIKKKKWKLNKMEWKVAISISLFYFVSSISSSHMSSFFPLVAMKKNMDATVTGLVLASYPLVTILASPLIGLWMPTVGVRFTLIAGSFLEGGTQILFGFVAEMPNYNTFVVFCFVIRCIGSLGSSMSQTAAIAIISVTFKDNLTKIIGITELFYGVGLMIGPVIGGGLFEVGNFRLPFFVIGSATLATLPCFFFLIPEKIVYKSEIVLVLNQKSVSLLQLMLVPGVLVIALVAICTQIGYAFVDPTLPKHLEDVTNNTLSSSQIGLCFLLWSVLYTGLTPILGLYSDKKVLTS